MSTPVTIVQLYPGELGVTGDRGNVEALRVRLERADVEAVVQRVGRGDALPADADIIVIGNGPLSAMRLVHSDLHARAADLTTFISDGGGLLAVGGGSELLGRGVELLDGTHVAGIGLFPFRVARTRERRVGYIVADTEHGRLVGFEDHASVWHLDADIAPYGDVVAGKGAVARPAGARGETVRLGEAYASNVQGPVLPLNPQLSDAILRVATARRGIEYVTGAGHEALDSYAATARATIERLAQVKQFTTIEL
jgi:CobQ-like glutamine amidotransferase family enzyme